MMRVTYLSFFFFLYQDIRNFAVQALDLLEPGLNDLWRNDAIANSILTRAVFNHSSEEFSIGFANQRHRSRKKK